MSSNVRNSETAHSSSKSFIGPIISTCNFLRHSLSTAIISLILALISLLFIFLRAVGHAILIERFGFLMMEGITYQKSDKISISIGRVKIALQLPRPSAPRYAILYIQDYEYRDGIVHYSCARLEITLWFFPVFFRVTNKPWADAKLYDLRIQTFQSNAEPQWLVNLRTNVISTILNGETVRLHKFKTRVSFNTPVPTSGTENGCEDGKLRLKEGKDVDEVRVKAEVEHWQIHGFKDRMYTFGKFDIEVRKNWTEERGTLVLVAEDCRWTKLPTFDQRQGRYRRMSQPIQVIWGLISFPMGVIRILRSPLSMADMHIVSTDITYEHFRIRDADLLKQTTVMARRELEKHRDVGWDSFVNLVLCLCFPKQKQM